MAVAKKTQEGTLAKGNSKLLPNLCDSHALSPYNKASETDIEMLLAEGKAAAASSYAGTSKSDNVAHKPSHEPPSNSSITIRGAASMQRSDNKSKATDNSVGSSIADTPTRNDANIRTSIPLPQKLLEPRKPCSLDQTKLQLHSSTEEKYSANYHQLTPLASSSQSSDAPIDGGMTPTSITFQTALQGQGVAENEFQDLDPQGLQDLQRWLFFTGYYNENYRSRANSRYQRLAALDEEWAETMREEQRERQAFADRLNIGFSSPQFSHMVTMGGRNTTPYSSSALLSQPESQVKGVAERGQTPVIKMSKTESESSTEGSSLPLQPTKRGNLASPEDKEGQRKAARADGQATPNGLRKQDPIGAYDRQPNNNYPRSPYGGRKCRRIRGDSYRGGGAFRESSPLSLKSDEKRRTKREEETFQSY